MGQRPSHPSPNPTPTLTTTTTTWPPHAQITLWTNAQDSILINVTTITITDGNNATHTLSFTNGTGNIVPPEVAEWWRQYGERSPWWVLLSLLSIGAVLVVVARLGKRWEDRRDRKRMERDKLSRVVGGESGSGELGRC